MIKEIEIKDFKGIKYLKLGGLRRINVLNGPNGCGKTRVLQAINIRSMLSPSLYLGNKIYYKAIEHSLLQEINAESDKRPIFSLLKKIEPRLTEIEISIGFRILFKCNGVLLGTELMGQGFQRVLEIISAITYLKDGFLLIDEIDMGLHYSVLIPVWRAIIESAILNDVTIFATTHSEECIRALSVLVNEDEKFADATAIIQLCYDDEKHLSNTLRDDTVKASYRSGLDLRY